jgi:hypothetical protein
MRSKPDSGSTLTLDLTPESFFFELVRTSADKRKLRMEPETEFYVVRLLNRFIFSESLYSKSSDGSLEDQPLAFLYKEALEAAAQGEQKTLFQNVGDISLFKAGFFQESLSRTRMDVGYYIGLGGAAYKNAADRSEERHFRDLFSDLSKRFGTMVDLLSDVSESTTFARTEQDLVRLYDMWARTGSERAARTLSRTGIRLEKDRPKKDS